jgi:Fur family iron response transcriptional regulator
MTDALTLTPSRTAARERAAGWLTAASMRPTRQRLALAELLVGDGRNRHVTAEGLYDAAALRGAAVSLATVYNTLRAFCDAGLMTEVTVDGSRSYFDTRVEEHPHYYWEDDGRLTDAPNHAARLAADPVAPPGRRSPAWTWSSACAAKA